MKPKKYFTIADRNQFKRHKGGIYFLLKNGVIVYIGKSSMIYERIAGHRSKDFNSFRVIKCDQNDTQHYEQRLIKLFKPVLNKNGFKGHTYFGKRELKKIRRKKLV